MLRTLVMAGVLAGALASVPMLFQHVLEAPDPAAAEPALQPSAPPQRQVAARTEPAPARPSGRSVRLDPDRSGHFQAEFRLNGRNVHGLIDTGASAVAINRSTARRIGISLANSDFRHEVATANGRTSAASATIDRMQIGRIEVRDVPAVVLEDRALEGTLIGMSFLSRLSGYRVEGGALTLEQ